MKKLIAILIALFTFVGVKANDGAFYSKGNQLIPVNETTIRVQKEILKITRINDKNKYGNLFQVDVYYEFFNPGKAKDIIVGFESPTPDGNGYEGTLDEVYKGHPYIYDFKVVMNEKSLSYQLAHVPYKYEGNYQFNYTTGTEDYYKDGRVQDMTKEQYSVTMSKIYKDQEEYLDMIGYRFYYVYYFNAHFNEGLNVVKHTYTFKGSDLVMMDYLFDYILTAANRWANNGIDDFTLELNMGDRESFCVSPTFFKDTCEWSFTGKGKASIGTAMAEGVKSCPKFHVQTGSIVFHKENFHPEGELHISRDSFYLFDFDYDKNDSKHQEAVLEALKTQYYHLRTDLIIADDNESFSAEQKRVMKNIPFAYHGYVFEDKSLQQYFDSTEWYVPNPNYKSDMNSMSKDEVEWIQLWSK